MLGLNELPVTAEDFAQPRELWRRVFDETERRKWVTAVAASLEGVPEELQRAAIAMFNNVDPEIGRMIGGRLKESARL